jgi:hypothetical protein
MHPGYVSLLLKDNVSAHEAFSEVRNLDASMHQEYSRMENLFTDKRVDHSTNRYIPRQMDERMDLMKKYIEDNKNWLSTESINLLYYLASNIKLAAGNDFRKMDAADEAWLTKGYAGMINFSLTYGSDNVPVLIGMLVMKF